MKKRFAYIILLVIGAMIVVAWANTFLVDEYLDTEKTAERLMQETNIQTEALSEEKKVPEKSEGAKENEPVIPVSEPIIEAPKGSLIEDVPFTVQAPFGEWDDPVFQNGCEEASLVMAAYWLFGKPLSKESAKQEIVALAGFEDAWLGHSIDTSAEDTLKLFQEYYDITAGEVRTDIVLADIVEALASGSIVIVPADGRKLRNPYFTQPGPTRHMLVIIGYDAETKEFITNDPGTKHGEGYRYPEKTLFEAILNYPTGDHLPMEAIRKVMIVIRKM